MKSEEEEGKREKGKGKREQGIALLQAQVKGRGEHSGEVRLNSAIRNPKSAIRNSQERGYDHVEGENNTEHGRGVSA